MLEWLEPKVIESEQTHCCTLIDFCVVCPKNLLYITCSCFYGEYTYTIANEMYDPSTRAKFPDARFQITAIEIVDRYSLLTKKYGYYSKRTASKKKRKS